MRTISSLAAAAALLLLASFAAAPARANDLLKGKTYYFGTHPARTNITFVSEADLETIHGTTHAIDGSVAVEAGGKEASGLLKVSVATMRTGIDLRDEHLRSDKGLDAKKFPTIDLQLVSATESKDGRTWDYVAKLTIKGKTKEFEGEARITAFPDHVGKALGDGSWVRVRTDFEVKLADFGVTIPDQVGPKVSATWQIGIDLYGTTAKPRIR
jgi:polyisoprenoid-binding protein YceI